MWSGAWNKAHFRNLLPNRFLSSSVGKALEWWLGGCGFKPRWGQFLMIFFLFCVYRNASDFLIVKKPQGSLVVDARFVLQSDMDCNFGEYIHVLPNTDLEACKIWCGESEHCGGFTSNLGLCWFKDTTCDLNIIPRATTLYLKQFWMGILPNDNLRLYIFFEGVLHKKL